MKIETQFLEDHQAKITATFDADEIAQAKRRAAQQLAKQVRVPGFRPGKAPYNVIERAVGAEAIDKAALEWMVKENYPKVLKETDIKPFDAGSLEEASIETGILEFVVPLEPDVTVGDYLALRQPYELPTATDDDLNRVLDDLRERQAVLEPASRPAQVGDQIVIQLSSKRTQVEEGQDPNIIEERSQPINILAEDADTSDEWPFPGFSNPFIGAIVGDEKTQVYTYPEDYTYESLRNVEAEFQARVEEIKGRTLPEVNDDFAKSVGDFENLEALKTRIRQNLEVQKRQDYIGEYTDQLVTTLTSLSTIKYPPQMLEREIDSMVREFIQRVEKAGLDFPTYLKTQNTDEAAFRQELKPAAENRLRRTLVIMQMGRQEDIQVDQRQVEWQASQMLQQFNKQASGKDARKINSQEFVYNLVNNITADVFTQNTLERLRTIAKGEADTPQADPVPESTESPAASEPAPSGEEPQS